MKIYGILVFVLLIFGSCAQKEDTLKPGEKYMIDTMMFKRQRSIDSTINKICSENSDSIYMAAMDSLFKVRSKDIMLIRGDGKPPDRNRFQEILNSKSPIPAGNE